MTPPAAATLTQLEAQYPRIAWRQPIGVSVAGGPEHLACRVCIAREGLRAEQIAERAFATDEAFAEHIRQHEAEGS